MCKKANYSLIKIPGTIYKVKPFFISEIIVQALKISLFTKLRKLFNVGCLKFNPLCLE